MGQWRGGATAPGGMYNAGALPSGEEPTARDQRAPCLHKSEHHWALLPPCAARILATAATMAACTEGVAATMPPARSGK